MDSRVKFEDLVFGEVIGRGNFGVVYRGELLGTPVAIKRLTESLDEPDAAKYWEREVTTLAEARHPNIVQFMGVTVDDKNRLYILTEYVDGRGDLRKVNESEDMPWRRRIEIALGIAKAVAYLHGRDIIHRDLKSENILIGRDYSVKVCDFGFARPQDTRKHMTMCGTDWTMAPEIMLCMDYNESVDVFSYGMVLAELFSRVKPDARHFKRVIPGFGLDDAEVRSLIQPGCPPDLVDLVLRCVSDTPKQRPSCADVVRTLTALLPSNTLAPAAPPSSSTSAPAEPAVPAVSAATAVPAAAAAAAVVVPASTGAAVPLTVTGSSGDIAALAAKLNAARIEDADRVQVRRVVEGGRYHYHAVNLRDYAVRLRIAIESTSAAIRPYDGIADRDPLAVSQVTSDAAGTFVEAVVASKSGGWLASITSTDPSGDISFSTSLLARPADVEVRRSEMSKVTLETRIHHNKTPTVISFFASNLNDVAVEVEVTVDGAVVAVNDAPVARDAGPAVVKGVVAAGTVGAVPLGSVTCDGPVSQNWRFASTGAPPLREQSSLLRGVRLLKRAGAQPGSIELNIDNTHDKRIRVEIGLEGTITSGLESNPLVAVLGPKESRKIATLICSSDVLVDWRWDDHQ